jgi:hypothetical protein
LVCKALSELDLPVRKRANGKPHQRDDADGMTIPLCILNCDNSLGGKTPSPRNNSRTFLDNERTFHWLSRNRSEQKIKKPSWFMVGPGGLEPPTKRL